MRFGDIWFIGASVALLCVELGCLRGDGLLLAFTCGCLVVPVGCVHVWMFLIVIVFISFFGFW